MAERTRGYAHRIDVRSPVELVWRALLEPPLLAKWYGPEARIAARAGGSYRVRADRDLLREAHIDVFEPARRLRLIYMPPANLPVSDAVVVDDFILNMEGDTAVLRLLGSGFPQDESWDAYYQRLRGGWAPALARLKVCTEQLASADTAARVGAAAAAGAAGAADMIPMPGTSALEAPSAPTRRAFSNR